MNVDTMRSTIQKFLTEFIEDNIDFIEKYSLKLRDFYRSQFYSLDSAGRKMHPSDYALGMMIKSVVPWNGDKSTKCDSIETIRMKYECDITVHHLPYYYVWMQFNGWFDVNIQDRSKSILNRLVHWIQLKRGYNSILDYEISEADVTVALHTNDTAWLTMMCTESDNDSLRRMLFDEINQSECTDLNEIKMICLNEMNKRGEIRQSESFRL